MTFLVRILVGFIAGWFAGQMWKGGGYGVVADIVFGVLGGLLGGWSLGRFGLWPSDGMIGSIISAFAGGVILVWITHWLRKA